MRKKIDMAERKRIAAQFAIDGKTMWFDTNKPKQGWKSNAAAHLGVTPQTVSNWLKGATPIPPAVLGLVAQALSRQEDQQPLTGDAARDELAPTSTHRN